MVQHCLRISGATPHFFVKQPYYLKHSPGNPAFGSVHDGVTTTYGQGYTFKPMAWLYRFRWNSQHRGAIPMYLRNPGGKWSHWLEVSLVKKSITAMTNHESFPHVACAMIVIAFTSWQILRYLFFHPELTVYMLAMYPTKVWLTMQRYNEHHPMDKPVFRYAQQVPEFYYYNSNRDMMKMGIAANDPFVEHMKKIGREQDLYRYADDKGGYADLVSLLPYEWRRKPQSGSH